MNEEICEQCHWWFESNGMEMDYKDEYGDCKRHAPSAVTSLSTSSEFGRRISHGFGFPGTHKDDYCGDYKPKEKE